MKVILYQSARYSCEMRYAAETYREKVVIDLDVPYRVDFIVLSYLLLALICLSTRAVLNAGYIISVNGLALPSYYSITRPKTSTCRSSVRTIS